MRLKTKVLKSLLFSQWYDGSQKISRKVLLNIKTFSKCSGMIGETTTTTVSESTTIGTTKPKKKDTKKVQPKLLGVTLNQ